MKLLENVTLLFSLSLAFPAIAQDRDALGELFPPSEILDRSTLDLKVIQRETVDHRTVPGGKVEEIVLEFTAFEWAGETWRHKVVARIPANPPAPYRGGALITSGRGIFDSALRLGLAAANIEGVPGRKYGETHAGRVMMVGLKKALETGNFRWEGYGWLARVYMRAATALEALEGSEIHRFVVQGGSKKGQASWMAVAADDRFVGAVPFSWNRGNAKETLRLEVERLGVDHRRGGKGTPSGQTPAQMLEQISTPMGTKWLQIGDPYYYRDRIAGKKVLYMAGVVDPLFHVAHCTLFLPHMPEGVRILLAPNVGHGSSDWHKTATVMWLAHIFQGRDVPRIDVNQTTRNGRLHVTAKVDSETQITKVELWSVVDPTGAYRKDEANPWQATAMNEARDGVYQAALPLPRDGVLGYIIMVEDDDPESVPGVITSSFHEWGYGS